MTMKSGTVSILLSFLCAGMAAAETSVLVDIRGGGAMTPLPVVAGKDGGRVTGVLPAGWRENSSPGTVWVRYSMGTDGSLRFFRMDVTKLEAGYGRLYHVLPPIERGSICRLRFKARARRPMALRIGIRLQDLPGADAVGCDAVRAEFGREPAGEVDHPTLRRLIRGTRPRFHVEAFVHPKVGRRKPVD